VEAAADVVVETGYKFGAVPVRAGLVKVIVRLQQQEKKNNTNAAGAAAAAAGYNKSMCMC
jgi:hypothetical protein